MANRAHLRWLSQGRNTWNLLRESRHFVPSLKNADLRDKDLSGMNLSGAQLSGADLRGAILKGAILRGAQLYGANLAHADLSFAQMSAAVLASADLSSAVLAHCQADKCDFRRAQMFNSILSTGFFVGSDFTRAKLSEADVRSSNREAVDFRYSKGLTQRQLDEMTGDTGVMLPDDLRHPQTWPEWIDQDATDFLEGDAAIVSDLHLVSEISTSDKFVFISYSNKDKKLAMNLKSVLAEFGVATWWDENISAGDGWRSSINDHLREAAAVLVIWTSNSTVSKPVIEEAATAQSNNKLVHARFDEAALPYGFSETQYADLRGWDGREDDVELRKLVQSLKDKISPPNDNEIRRRLENAAPLKAVLEDGKISAKDSPPNAPPLHQDADDLEARLGAQQNLTEKLLSTLQKLDNNLGEAVVIDLGHYLKQVQVRPASWYILSDSIADVRFYLEMGDEFSWPGSTKNGIEILCKNHEGLRHLLQPIQPPPFSQESPIPAPFPDPKKLSDQTLIDITEVANEAFHSAEAEQVLAKSALMAGEYLSIEIDEARQSRPTGDRSSEKRSKKLLSSIVVLSGFVASIISGLTAGISTNLLTSPEAVKTFLPLLKKLFDLLSGLF